MIHERRDDLSGALGRVGNRLLGCFHSPSEHLLRHCFRVPDTEGCTVLDLRQAAGLLPAIAAVKWCRGKARHVPRDIHYTSLPLHQCALPMTHTAASSYEFW